MIESLQKDLTAEDIAQIDSIKTKIVFIAGHDVVIRNFIAAGAMRSLLGQYNVTIVYSDSVTNPHFSSKSVVINFIKNQNAFIKKVDLYLWYLAYFKYIRKTGNLKEGLSCSFKASALSKRMKKILVMLSLPLIYEFIMWFFSHIVIRCDAEILKILKKIKPAIVIVPGCTFDSFGMQAINAARRLKIKSIMPVAHWDYLSRKGILRAIPDHICVWGEQMRRLAVDFHKIPEAQVSVVGVSHFQTYFDYQGKSGPGTHVNLWQTKSLLFAGAGIAYDELTPLKLIDRQISSASLGEVKIIYRPHPKQHPRKCEYIFKQDDYKNTVLDSKQASHTGGKSAYEPMEYYLELLNKVDGIITPFSTMLLEAAVCGKPSFVLAFSDGVHDWDFENILKAEHISDLLRFEWVVFCRKKGELLGKFNDFLKIVETPDIAEKIRQDVKDIIYHDRNSYDTRFSLFIENYLK